MPAIRPFETNDWPVVWNLIEPVFRAGDTYCVDTGIAQAEAQRYWVETPEATFVTEDADGRALGSYYLKPNQPGAGAHVCNCGYIVAASARGRGVASAMCEHSQAEARARGFLAMQYNFVVATNHNAIRLWRRLGFDIVGTLPGAFCHPTDGFVDAHVMYKRLDG